MMRAADSGMETAERHPITLVTAYFELGGKPEHPELENPYPGWIRNFLPHVRWPLVVFCDEQSLDMLKEARGDKPAVWHVTRPEDFYVYKYLEDLKRLSFPAERAEAFVVRSLVWHEKHHFLRQTLSENPFGSEMFFWYDIAKLRYEPDAPWWSSRRRAFRLFEDIEWPNLEVCRALPKDKVVLAGAPYDAMAGCFFGGAIEPSRRWCDAYYQRLERRKQNGSLTEREEYVMMSCWRRQPELAHVISSYSAPYTVFLKKQRPALDFEWYLLNGRRLPWRYFCRRLISGPVR
ncbi:MAG: hypothetical protein OXU50_01445 [Gammaproteobacteria bacterium]|nr:hypothetical protein [Gammaproteobacteria bacterium]